MKKTVSMIITMVMLVSLLLSGCDSIAPADSTNPTVTAQPEGPADTKPEEPKNVELRIAWWGNQTRNDGTQKVMDLFHKKNENVTMQGEFVDWSGYWQKLATQASANSLPDIIQMDYSYIDQYVNKNLLLDLTEYTTNGLLDVSDISGNILSSGRIKDGLYGISLGSNALALFYDPAVFQEAGINAPTAQWTWQQYTEILTQVHKATGKQSDALLSVDPQITIEYIARQKGYPLFSADGKSLGFTDPAIPQFVFELVDNMTSAEIFISPDKVPTGTPLEDTPFVKGETFMGSGWSNQFVATVNAANRPLEMISLPLDGDNMGLYNKPSMFFSVTQASQNKEGAVKFINFFANDLDANKILLAERGVPIAAGIREGIKSQVAEAVAKTFNYIEKINDVDKVTGLIDPPAPSASGQVNSLAKNLYDQVAFGRLEPKAAAEQFIEEANDILAKAE